jgi:hypothetical protein
MIGFAKSSTDSCGPRVFVMPGLVPGIHVLLFSDAAKTWMAGTSPAMTAATFWCDGQITVSEKQNSFSVCQALSEKIFLFSPTPNHLHTILILSR